MRRLQVQPAKARAGDYASSSASNVGNSPTIQDDETDERCTAGVIEVSNRFRERLMLLDRRFKY
jgi:hypothetical protein